jgi:hypothetical protein
MEFARNQPRQWQSLACQALLYALFLIVAAPSFASNPTDDENRNHTGSSGWQLTNRAPDAIAAIKGYASATSVNKGGSITLYVSVYPDGSTYSIDVYRIGWYNGAGGRQMGNTVNMTGVMQAACPQAPLMPPSSPRPPGDDPWPIGSTGVTECNWSGGYTLNVGTDWTSGVYLARLINTSNNHYDNYVTFVVRDDARTADFLYVQPVTTYEAYNTYPSGTYPHYSLYDDWAHEGGTSGATAVVKVSFDRPYSGDGAGNFLANGEIHFVQWAEANHYDIVYGTSIDVAGELNLLRYKGVLFVGHDEYWTSSMRGNAETARNLGVNLGFFGGNDVVWQIRLEPGSSGANRVIVCYRDTVRDPDSASAPQTIKWRDLTPSRPEQTLVGVQYGADINAPSSTPGDGNQDYVPTNTGTAVGYETVSGTGLNVYGGISAGSYISPVKVGYETDHFYSSNDPITPYAGPYTLREGVVTLSASPIHSESTAEYWNQPNSPNSASLIQNSTIYQANSGAWVFAAGTLNWAGWLCVSTACSANASAALQGMTKNILDKYSLASRARGLAAVNAALSAN